MVQTGPAGPFQAIGRCLAQTEQVAVLRDLLAECSPRTRASVSLSCPSSRALMR